MRSLLPALALLVLLSGCAQLDTVRLGQDRPGDLQALMDRHEYARAGQLLDRYPHLDTAERRQLLHDGISRYENTMLDSAQAKAGDDNLVGAIGVLDEALLKVPGSTRLQFYRDELDSRRAARLQENERQKLMSRARFLLDEQQFYDEQLNLDPPDFAERWKNSRNRQEIIRLHAELLDCGREKLELHALEPAGECLSLASEIDNTDEVAAVLARLESERSSARTIVAKQAKITRVKKQRTLKKKHINRTQDLLASTQTALDDNDLELARKSFDSIPRSTRGDENVMAMEERLDAAIAARVTGLLDRGDRQYRADKVTAAIATWSKAQAIDPENKEVSERLQRANKVLARLEELKSRQK
jgi:hypothetical protein